MFQMDLPLMPKGSPSYSSLTNLRDAIDALQLSPAVAAKKMGLERTLIWRAYKGKPVTQTNAAVIAQRLHLLTGKSAGTTERAYATNMLRFLLRAVEQYSIEDTPDEAAPSEDG
jgi:hypothetical protein